LASSCCRSRRHSGTAARTRFGLVALVCAASPLSLFAQAQFAGTVIRVVAGDTVTVPGAVMQLHRVSQLAQGVIDSGRTDGRGRWSFRTRLDEGANYLVSARFAGIEFFTPPLATDRARPDTGVRIVVADTSSGPEARVVMSSRHLLVQGGDSAGWRGVLDVVVLENHSGYTRIAADTTRPAFVMLLPPDAHDPELADGDIGPEAVRFHDGALELYAPLAPGEASLTIQYLLPAERAVGIPIGDTVATFNLLIDGEGAAIAGPRLEGPIPTTVEGREFRRWSAPVPGGTVVQLDLRAARTTPKWLLAALVIAMAAVLVTTLVVARRGPGLAKPRVAP
jgi:hypothetical protein